jgi:GrpB-like predicted nucleotidyltransferase (UPF0157 family)
MPRQLSEDYIREVTVGEREPHNATIHLGEYDPEWATLFELERAQINAALGEKALVVEHVGSTSVPGLAAKPILDILLVVADSADESEYVDVLAGCGYALRIREPDWFEHRCLRRGQPAGHLHVFSLGCPEVERMLRFRDRLRMSDEDRKLYEATKRQLASNTWKHVQNYADAKGEVVELILSRAGVDPPARG